MFVSIIWWFNQWKNLLRFKLEFIFLSFKLQLLEKIIDHCQRVFHWSFPVCKCTSSQGIQSPQMNQWIMDMTRMIWKLKSQQKKLSTVDVCLYILARKETHWCFERCTLSKHKPSLLCDCINLLKSKLVTLNSVTKQETYQLVSVYFKINNILTINSDKIVFMYCICTNTWSRN